MLIVNLIQLPSIATLYLKNVHLKQIVMLSVQLMSNALQRMQPTYAILEGVLLSQFVFVISRSVNIITRNIRLVLIKMMRVDTVP